MKRITTFIRNIIATPYLPALVMFIAAGLCAGLALIAVGQNNVHRADYSAGLALLFTLAAFVCKDMQK